MIHLRRPTTTTVSSSINTIQQCLSLIVIAGTFFLLCQKNLLTFALSTSSNTHQQPLLQQQPRRDFLQRHLIIASLGIMSSSSSSHQNFVAHASSSSINNNDNNDEANNNEIIKLLSGVQYRDIRIGHGEIIQRNDTIVLHLQILLRDGTILLDTHIDNNQQPIIYRIGSIPETTALLGGKTLSPITIGLEDGILGRGIPGGAMKFGGIRKIVVPSSLGYGTAGLSAYDNYKYKLNLRQGVPRNELLRYEIEILRCQDVPITISEEQTKEGGEEQGTRTVIVQTCCSEPKFPCQVPNSGTTAQQ